MLISLGLAELGRVDERQWCVQRVSLEDELVNGWFLVETMAREATGLEAVVFGVGCY